MMWGQFDDNGICVTISELETGIEATLENIGQKREWVETYTNIDGEIIEGRWEWKDVSKQAKPIQPSNTEIAQMISDLQADLIIAGVI